MQRGQRVEGGISSQTHCGTPARSAQRTGVQLRAPEVRPQAAPTATVSCNVWLGRAAWVGSGSSCKLKRRASVEPSLLHHRQTPPAHLDSDELLCVRGAQRLPVLPHDPAVRMRVDPTPELGDERGSIEGVLARTFHLKLAKPCLRLVETSARSVVTEASASPIPEADQDSAQRFWRLVQFENNLGWEHPQLTVITTPECPLQNQGVRIAEFCRFEEDTVGPVAGSD